MKCGHHGEAGSGEARGVVAKRREEEARMGWRRSPMSGPVVELMVVGGGSGRGWTQGRGGRKWGKGVAPLCMPVFEWRREVGSEEDGDRSGES